MGLTPKTVGFTTVRLVMRLAVRVAVWSSRSKVSCVGGHDDYHAGVLRK